MSEELTALPEVPNGDSLGEGGDNGETAAEPPKINLDDLPDFRNWKSAKDKEIAAERQARLEAQQKAARLEAERDTLDSVLNTSLSPDEQEAARQRIVLAAQEGELREYKRRDWENFWVNAARDAGIDPAGEDFQRALWEAKQAGSNGPLQVKVEVARQMAALKQDIVPHNTPAPAQEEAVKDSPQPRPGSDGYVIPPRGKPMTGGPARVEDINTELLNLYKEPTKNAARIEALKRERDQLSSGG